MNHRTRRCLGTTACLATILLVSTACGSSTEPQPDPGPAAIGPFGTPRQVGDHRQMDVRFTSAGDTLRGTLYLPLTGGPFPTVVVSPGSEWTTRSTWNDVGPFVTGLGAAAFSYDKRGSGVSGGSCCSGSLGETFEVLASDAAAAVQVLATSTLVNPALLGLYGSSQGGWVVPLVAAKLPQAVRFVIVVSGGAVSTGQEGRYDQLTGLAGCQRTETPLDDIIAQLEADGPSGFDPTASLEAMTQRAIFLYGANDMSHPAALAVKNLKAIRSAQSKDWTVKVLPGANHDMIQDGSICQKAGPVATGFYETLSAWGAELLR